MSSPSCVLSTTADNGRAALVVHKLTKGRVSFARQMQQGDTVNTGLGGNNILQRFKLNGQTALITGAACSKHLAEFRTCRLSAYEMCLKSCNMY